MEAESLVDRIAYNMEGALVDNCPIVSRSMQSHITYRKEGVKKYVITISGPSYDVTEWRKSKMVIYDGKYNYAWKVNYGKNRKSGHWVDNVITMVLDAIGSQFGALINDERIYK